MESIFLHLLNMSVTAGWLALAVMLIRLLLKRAPRWLVCLLWILVGARLLLPISFESILSLIPSAEPLPSDITVTTRPHIDSGIGVIDSTVNPVILDHLAPTAGASVNPMQIVTRVASIVWLCGVAAMLLYMTFSYLRIRYCVREAVPYGEANVLVSDRISSPFILGFFRPRIYLPTAMEQSDIDYVLAHERAHLRRRDHLWKPIGFLLLSVYWFNPILWVAYVLLCRDIELACDERVVRELGIEKKRPYAEALLNCSLPRRMVSACPVAFGEVSVKTRIIAIMHYKKPALWVTILSLVLIAVVAVCFLTNPPGGTDVEINEQLSQFIEVEISNQLMSESAHNNPSACFQDIAVLGAEKRGENISVYLWVMYQEYSFEPELKLETAIHIPAVITVREVSFRYELVEYWTPRVGADYENDVRAKFPKELWNDALDKERYAEQQAATCAQKAQDWYTQYSGAPTVGTMMKYQLYGFISLKDYASTVIELGDYACNAEGLTFNLQCVREENGGVVFDILWTNISDHTQTIEADFVLYKKVEPYKKSSDAYEELPPKSAQSGETYSLEPNTSMLCSYALSEVYELNSSRSYRLEANDAWVNFYVDYYYESVFGGGVPDADNHMVTADLDRDGREEICTVGPGWTSGIYTYMIYVWDAESGILKYDTWGYYPDMVQLVKSSDGSVQVQGEEESGKVLLDLVLFEGELILTRDGHFYENK